MTPMEAIKSKCLDCCCGQKTEVKLCTSTSCPLYEFRLGKNPNRKSRELTDEQKQQAAERMRMARLAKNH